MARASATIKTIKTFEDVTLTMSPMEAKFLIAVLSRMGGSSSYSAREYADSILNAMSHLRSDLEQSIIGTIDGRDKSIRVDMEKSPRGSIYFKDYRD